MSGKFIGIWGPTGDPVFEGDVRAASIYGVKCARPANMGEMLDLFGCAGVTEVLLGQAQVEQKPEWKCAYCTTVTGWRAQDAPPTKCTACGAPREMGT